LGGDRLDALESQLNQRWKPLSRNYNQQVGTAVAELQSQVDQVRGDCARVGETMYQMASQTGSQLKILGSDLDTLKSSLEVPQEMVDDFFDWSRATQSLRIRW